MHSQIGFLNRLDQVRSTINGCTSRRRRSEMGQFFTPSPIARFMASLFEQSAGEVRILDAGAGVGVLFSACVEAIVANAIKPSSIEVVAYETDEDVLPYLDYAMEQCGQLCARENIPFKGQVRAQSFLEAGISCSGEDLFSDDAPLFTHAILNPPYRKIHARSNDRKLLNAAGIGVSNKYAAFVWIAARMLAKHGQLVAITPRSFCNGPYFRTFRRALLDMMSFRRFHVFNSRKKAFGDDDVLQENIIFHAVRGVPKRKSVIISSSDGADFEESSSRGAFFEDLIIPGDKDSFIHLPSSDEDSGTIAAMACFNTSLAELGLDVSTGRVVDFRARDFLLSEPEKDSAPLIYPCHFKDGFVAWPSNAGKKPNAISIHEDSRSLLVDSGHYVLTKRFTSKEEPRRVVAAVLDPSRIGSQLLGFENHLNYFHHQGGGIAPQVAKGLALYLNCSVFDRYFRLFSGHTQVNATDLRKMRYPTGQQLESLGRRVGETMPDQGNTDTLVEEVCG